MGQMSELRALGGVNNECSSCHRQAEIGFKNDRENVSTDDCAYVLTEE